MAPHRRTWFDAWVDAAAGPAGFYSLNRPTDHFRTAAATPDALDRLISGLLRSHPEIRAVVDVGSGSGELLQGLAALRPGLALTGIDLRPRPAGLPEPIGWVRDHWDVRTDRWTDGRATGLLRGLQTPTLVVASEWLDDLACPVAAYGLTGWCELCVDETGNESSGAALSGAALAWARRWWPTGSRAEIGLTRDRAWAALVRAAVACGGAALLVDYGHLDRTRPDQGSLTGYHQGRQTEPRPDGTVNLTAHVAVDAVRAAGEAAGATTRRWQRQDELVDELWPPTRSPDPLADLVRRSHRSALTSPSGWGSQWWLWQS